MKALHQFGADLLAFQGLSEHAVMELVDANSYCGQYCPHDGRLCCGR